jgi:hypothetical protein
MDPDGSRRAVWLRPERQYRGTNAVRYLLDGRLFRLFASPAGEAALAAFRVSVARLGFEPGQDLPPLELTPLGFLDVIGIDPPHFDPFPLPPRVLKPGEALMATTVVFKLIEEKFRDAPELQADFIKKRAAELKEKTPPAAHDLFDLCVTDFIAREETVNEIVRQLSFDFAYRFPFPDVLREEVIDFLYASLLAAGETVAGLSKMRSIKMLWDRVYPRLLKVNPGARAELQALDREMRLWTRQDFLDWEMVHHAVLGSAIKNGFRPVTAFTPDPAERSRARAIAYKSALRSFLDQISQDDLVKMRSKLLSWRPGTLVPCRDDGTFETPVSTGELPLFVGEKAGGR